jgi:predicted transcriptional regulator
MSKKKTVEKTVQDTIPIILDRKVSYKWVIYQSNTEYKVIQSIYDVLCVYKVSCGEDCTCE